MVLVLAKLMLFAHYNGVYWCSTKAYGGGRGGICLSGIFSNWFS